MSLSEENVDLLSLALKKALVDDEHSPILVKGRIQRICDDINSIKADMWWHKWLLLGIASGIGLLALKTLGV